jgi:histone acetyltransferase (RNA polymerase elongator complex component)
MEDLLDTIPIIPIFIPMLGCPNTCIYCDQRNITGATVIRPEEIRDYIMNDRNYNNGKAFELAFYGGTFTGLAFELMEEYLREAWQIEGLVRIRVSTRPDMLTDRIFGLLKHYRVRTIELGVQSFSTEVLRISGRGYAPKTAIQAALDVKKNGFRLGLQLMPGLPGDNTGIFRQTVRTAIKLKPDFVRLYPAVVITGTRLAKMFLNGSYQALSLDEGVRICAEAVMRFREKGIPVIRIGLRSMKDEKIVLGGCYHPQFKYMVESMIIRINILKALKKMKPAPLTIRAVPGLANYINGFKKENTLMFEQMGFRPFSLTTDTMLAENTILLNKQRIRVAGTDLP